MVFGIFKICQAEQVEGAEKVTVSTKTEAEEDYQQAYVGAEIPNGAPLPLLAELKEKPSDAPARAASSASIGNSQIRAPGSPRKLYGDGSPIRGHSPRNIPEPESPRVMVGSPRAQRDFVTDATLNDLKIDRKIEIRPFSEHNAERKEIQREIVHHHIFDAERRQNRGDDIDQRAHMEAGGWTDALDYTHGTPDDQPFTTIGGRNGNFEADVDRW